MRKGAIIAPQMRCVFALLILFASVDVRAQKAKPVEIILYKGEGVAHGRLTARQQMDYEVQASGRMLTMIMRVEPRNTLDIRMYDPDGMLMPLHKTASRWTADLSKSGIYGITVIRTKSSARPSTYRLSMTVR